MGRVESFLIWNKVKRMPYSHEVSLTSLLSLATKPFKCQDNIYTFEAWQEQLSTKLPTAAFWFTLIEMKTLLIMFTTSCLQDILP